MPPRHRPPRWLAGAAAAASLAALALFHAAGGTGPPLYDGLCLPPSYFSLGAHPGPASASATYSSADLNQTQELATTEQTPQAQVILASGSFTVPAGTSVTVTITPVPPPSQPPAGGTIAGNAYRFAAKTSAGQALDLVPGHPATIVLAAPRSGGPQLTLEHFTGSSWSALKTFQSGCGDTEEAASPSLGIFALVAGGSSGPTDGGAPPAAGSGPPVILIVIVILVVILGGIVVAIRLSRRRRGSPRRRQR